MKLIIGRFYEYKDYKGTSNAFEVKVVDFGKWYVIFWESERFPEELMEIKDFKENYALKKRKWWWN